MSKETELAVIPISPTGELVYNYWSELSSISRQIMDAGITKLGNPNQINLIILKGRRLGLDIFEALENISVINNKTSINGALASALVERSGKLVDKSHEFKGEGDTRSCHVTVQRTGRSKVTWGFSLKEAKTAGLYPGKAGSGWSNYTDSMLYWRALGFCYRREFSDVLQGMYLTEELVDEVQNVQIVTETPPAPIKQAKIPKPDPVPFTPDPTDPKAHEHPLIAAPSDVGTAPYENPATLAEQKEQSAPLAPLAQLQDLAAKGAITNEELIEVVNGLRLFPRGAEHKLESLPETKLKTLIKNWSTVVRNADRLKADKESKAKEAAAGAKEAATA